jgi:low affinity Fe/Cu permease
MLGYILSEILADKIFYWTGYIFIKIVTLGKYPRRILGKKSREWDLPIITGFTIYLLIFIGFILINNGIIII